MLGELFGRTDIEAVGEGRGNINCMGDSEIRGVVSRYVGFGEDTGAGSSEFPIDWLGTRLAKDYSRRILIICAIEERRRYLMCLSFKEIIPSLFGVLAF